MFNNNEVRKCVFTSLPLLPVTKILADLTFGVECGVLNVFYKIKIFVLFIVLQTINPSYINPYELPAYWR